MPESISGDLNKFPQLQTDNKDQTSTTINKLFRRLKSFVIFSFRIFRKIWIVSSITIGSITLILMIIMLPLLAFMLPSLGSIGESSVEEKKIEGKGQEKIALVNLSGVIADEPSTNLLSSSEGYITPKQVKNLLDKAKSDPLVKALVLRINSPGGTVVASDEIFTQFKEFSRKTSIPIVTYLADTAASGGYYIAVAGNKVIAHPSSITGSIGVIAQVFNLEGLYNKVGIKPQVIKSGKFKDIGSDAREMTSEEREILQRIIDESYEKFLGVVSDSRKMKKEVLRPLADGRIYTGKQAAELKLIDGLGLLSDAVDEARSLAKLEQFSLVEYKISGGLFGSLAGFISQKIDSINPLKTLFNNKTASLLYLWIPD